MTDSFLPATPFHFDEGRENFDDQSRQNGFTHWLASQLMHWLGYTTMESFKRAINRAMVACSSLNIEITENFVPIARDGKTTDYKLSKFACYLTAMNADPKKPEVATAQAYFATLAEAFKKYVRSVEDVERVAIRDDVSQHERSLASTADGAGVQCYAFFHNAGYRGLYNMNFSELKALKRIPQDRSPLDFMGKTELAANLFRITQTEEKIKNEEIRGQHALETAAHNVGRKVRNTMMELSGTKPEDLPLAKDIKQVKSELKATAKGFRQLTKAKKQLPPPSDN